MLALLMESGPVDAQVMSDHAESRFALYREALICILNKLIRIYKYIYICLV